ncbi:MAG: acetyl-CoA decarbonylase/synthase complex subunit delta [Pseudomonadota bacterium]
MSELPVVKYVGRIREIKIGKPGTELVLGGGTAYSFYSFEGMNPNPPKLGLQVLDVAPEEWAPAAIEPFKDVIGDPVAWAKKCVGEYEADFVALWLLGTDPNGKNLPPEHAAEVARKVAEAIDVPLIVWGVSSDDKNRETLKAVCEACDGMNLAVGPITEHNYRQIGAAAIAYKHVVVANSPIDINLAKQLNILLETLGMPEDRIIIDPTTSSVGYGMEYCYSIMERIRQAALCQNDEKLQYPILNNIAEEVWKVKEAKLSEEQDPKLGNAVTRGINLESITAVSALNAGSDILILRHPETLKHIRKYVSDMMILTDLESMDIDLALTAEAPPAPTAKPAEKPKPALTVKPPAKPVAQAPAARETKPVEKPGIAPKTEPPAKPAAEAIAELPPAEKPKPVPKARPAAKPVGDETPSGELTKIQAASPKPAPSVESLSSVEDPEAVVFLKKLEEMDIEDDEMDRLKTALSVLRTIQTLEKKLGGAEAAGVSLEELDFSSDEISSYNAVRSLGRALAVVESKVNEAESAGKEVVETDFSKEDLNELRSGFAALKRIGIRAARPFEEERLEEVDLPDEDLEALRQMLGLFRAAKRVVLGIKKLMKGEAA